MCGIGAFINFNSNKKISFEDYLLLGELFSETESRGKHASGYVSLPPSKRGKKNNLIVKKAPIASSEFIKTDAWTELEETDIHSLIFHCRFLTRGKAENNENNHPFFSKDKRFALVHNGIVDIEDALIEHGIEQDPTIETDSYVIMQLIEKYLSEGITVTEAIKKTLELGVAGGYSCLMIDKKEKKLYTFRESGRPLQIYKNKDTLWFASTDSIFTNAFKNTFCPKEKLEITGEEAKKNTIYEYDLKNIDNVIETSFIPKKKTYRSYDQKSYSGYGSYCGYNDSGNHYKDYDNWFNGEQQSVKQTKCTDCHDGITYHSKNGSMRTCPTCDGTGYHNNTEKKEKNTNLCPRCNGTGQETLMSVDIEYGTQECTECLGTGKIEEVNIPIKIIVGD